MYDFIGIEEVYVADELAYGILRERWNMSRAHQAFDFLSYPTVTQTIEL